MAVRKRKRRLRGAPPLRPLILIRRDGVPVHPGIAREQRLARGYDRDERPNIHDIQRHKFVRIDQRGSRGVQRGTGWYKHMLRDVAQRTPAVAIQPTAIDALSDTDPEVVQSAVQALALVGDDHAKSALFERLSEWHAKWMGRERDLFWVPGEDPNTDDRHLGDELIHSLGTAAAWLLTEAEQRQLLQNAITDGQKQQVQLFIDAAKSRPIGITVIDSGFPHVQIIVGQYSYERTELAERKLSQFPAGTSFQIQSVTIESKAAHDTVEALQSFLAEHGMRIVPRKPE